jgi:hypothetical protein
MQEKAIKPQLYTQQNKYQKLYVQFELLMMGGGTA